MYVNTSLVKCITPPEDTRLGGGVSVHVSNNGEDLTQSSALFAYMNAFEIQSIEPTSGPILGGTLISIFGLQFVNVDDFTLSIRIRKRYCDLCLIGIKLSAYPRLQIQLILYP